MISRQSANGRLPAWATAMFASILLGLFGGLLLVAILIAEVVSEIGRST